jgi:hypothetical protein
MGGSLLTNMKNTSLHSSIKRYFGKEAKEAWREADATVVVRKLSANDKRGMLIIFAVRYNSSVWKQSCEYDVRVVRLYKLCLSDIYPVACQAKGVLVFSD